MSESTKQKNLRGLAENIANKLGAAEMLTGTVGDAALLINRALNQFRTAKFLKNMLDESIEAINNQIRDNPPPEILLKLVKEQRIHLEMAEEWGEKRRNKPGVIARKTAQREAKAAKVTDNAKLGQFDKL